MYRHKNRECFGNFYDDTCIYLGSIYWESKDRRQHEMFGMKGVFVLIGAVNINWFGCRWVGYI